jgi:hypothetical protein
MFCGTREIVAVLVLALVVVGVSAHVLSDREPQDPAATLS